MKVFLDYTQKELDDAYDQAVYAPNRTQLLARYASNSDIARRRLGKPERLSYGPTAMEQFDVFRARNRNAPINVFIHGGAWRAGSAKDSSFHAEMLVGAGANLVVLDFNSVLETGGSVLVMADQVRRGIAWAYRIAEKIGGNRDQLYVSGASSGAHLGGVAATTDWKKDFDLPADIVKGYTLCSGMFDLHAPSLSKRSAYVNFTDETKEKLSPQRHLDKINAPIALIYGSLETPEFQRQSRDFAEALRKAGKPVQLIIGEGYNHFEIAETFANPYGFAGRAVLEQMKLA